MEIVWLGTIVVLGLAQMGVLITALYMLKEARRPGLPGKKVAVGKRGGQKPTGTKKSEAMKAYWAKKKARQEQVPNGQSD